MQRNIIIGIRRGNMFSLYLVAFLFVALVLTLLHYLIKLPLDKLINPISLIPISIFLIFFILAFLKFLDKKPLIIITDSGISIRKSRLPFFGLEHINWDDIASYKAKVERFRHGTTKFLVIKRKSTNKKYYVDLFDLDTDNGDVLTGIRKYLQRQNLEE